MAEDPDVVADLFDLINSAPAALAKITEGAQRIAEGTEQLRAAEAAKVTLSTLPLGSAAGRAGPSALRPGGCLMSGVTLHPLGEVLAAARALSAGEFRQGPARPRPAVRPAVDPSVPAGWSPEAGERLVVVAGCGGGAGASTVALGVAQAAGVARVVETCTRAASGLVAATSAELGETDGWLRYPRPGGGGTSRGSAVRPADDSCAAAGGCAGDGGGFVVGSGSAGAGRRMAC